MCVGLVYCFSFSFVISFYENFEHAYHAHSLLKKKRVKKKKKTTTRKTSGKIVKQIDGMEFTFYSQSIHTPLKICKRCMCTQYLFLSVIVYMLKFDVPCTNYMYVCLCVCSICLIFSVPLPTFWICVCVCLCVIIPFK